MVILALGLQYIEKDETLQNLTIYTQAYSDWTSNTWDGFLWSRYEDPCPEEFYNFGQWWRGTKAGNFTDGGVKLAGDYYTG